MEPRPRRRPDAALVSPPPPPPSPSSSTLRAQCARAWPTRPTASSAMRRGLARRSRRGSRARPAVPAASLALLYPHLVAQRVIPRLEQHRRRDHLLPAQRSEPPRRLARTPARQLLEPRPRQLLESQPHQQSRLAELWRNGRAPAPSCRAVMEESHEQECRRHSSAHFPPPPSHITHAHLIVPPTENKFAAASAQHLETRGRPDAGDVGAGDVQGLRRRHGPVGSGVRRGRQMAHWAPAFVRPPPAFVGPAFSACSLLNVGLGPDSTDLGGIVRRLVRV